MNAKPSQPQKKQPNTWMARIIRNLLASVFPVHSSRHGACQRCGACCALPQRCIFLRTGTDGISYCSVYRFRPPSCRKYPRVPYEFLTEEQCGYHFDNPQ